MLAVLFTIFTAPPPPPCEHSKRHCSRENEEARSRKKKRTEMESARRDSLVDEEARQMRALELASGACSSRFDDVKRRTTEGADIAADTTDGVPTTDGAGFVKPDPPTC